jgi:hypothetical protein
MTSRAGRCALVLLVVGLCGMAAPEPERDLNARLAALDPTKPMQHFELAEELAAEGRAGRPERLAVARRLFVLAFVLDRQRPPSQAEGLAASAALALADLAGTEAERRWLRALAVRLDRERDGVAELAGRPWLEGEIPDRLALDVATALGSVRSGEGRRAARLLAEPGAMDLLRRYAGLLRAPDGVDPVGRLERQIEQWPACSQCRNRRTVSTPPRPGQTESTQRLCPTCAGSPGPRLEAAELVGHLRLESALLRGIARLWSASLLADGGEPLRDPEPFDVPIRFNVDPEATRFEAGQWVRPGGPGGSGGRGEPAGEAVPRPESPAVSPALPR